MRFPCRETCRCVSQRRSDTHCNTGVRKANFPTAGILSSCVWHLYNLIRHRFLLLRQADGAPAQPAAAQGAAAAGKAPTAGTPVGRPADGVGGAAQQVRHLQSLASTMHGSLGVAGPILVIQVLLRKNIKRKKHCCLGSRRRCKRIMSWQVQIVCGIHDSGALASAFSAQHPQAARCHASLLNGVWFCHACRRMLAVKQTTGPAYCFCWQDGSHDSNGLSVILSERNNAPAQQVLPGCLQKGAEGRDSRRTAAPDIQF